MAAAVGRTTAQLDVARNRLIYQHGLLRSPGRGLLQFRGGPLAEWVHTWHPPGPRLPPQ